MAHKTDSKPYVLDKMHELSELVHDLNKMYDRRAYTPEEMWSLISDTAYLSEKIETMLQKLLENEWWTTSRYRDSEVNPLDNQNNDGDDDGA